MSFTVKWLGALLAVVLAERPALAGGGAATDAYDDISRWVPVDVHGLADTYAQLDFNRPSSGAAQLRAFEIASNTVSLNHLGLTIGHRSEHFGFRVDAGVGDTANDYLRSDPAATSYHDVSRVLSFIQQVFVTAELPLGRGLTLDIGKFNTPVGLEDNLTLTNWNYAHSLLFTSAEPTFHTGLRATYPVAAALAVSAFWVNGWNTNILGGNAMRTFALAATWKPVEKLAVTFVYMGGPERAPTDLSSGALAFRNELDAYAIYRLTPQLSFALTADYGLDASGDGVSWWGISGYAQYQLLPWLTGAVRCEHFADPDGFTTGTRQRVGEATFTIDARKRIGDFSFLGRLEYRRDQSDTRFFETAGSPSLHQDTLTLALAASF